MQPGSHAGRALLVYFMKLLGERQTLSSWRVRSIILHPRSQPKPQAAPSAPQPGSSGRRLLGDAFQSSGLLWWAGSARLSAMASPRVFSVQYGRPVYRCVVWLGQCLRQFWNAHVLGFFGKREEEQIPPGKNIFHKEKIRVLGQTLKNKLLPIEERAQAAHRMGLLAFTGGPVAGRFVAEHMKEVVLLLQDAQAPPAARILLLQSVACWCYLNPTTQKRAKFLNLIPILTAMLDPNPDPQPEPAAGRSAGGLLVKFWACYALSVMTCNNVAHTEELREYYRLKHHLQVLAQESWEGWPENFAEVLYFLIGFHRH